MTHPHVKPASPVLAVPRALEASSGPAARSAPAAPRVALLTMPDHHAAANYDTAATLKLIRNPLWIIVIGMAWLFAIAMCVVVLAGAFVSGFADGDRRFDRAPIPIEMPWRP
jgi:hypothetical protein